MAIEDYFEGNMLARNPQQAAKELAYNLSFRREVPICSGCDSDSSVTRTL
jgi:hypothetical protein